MPPAQPDTSLEDPSPSRRHQVSGRDRVIGTHRVRAVGHAGEVHYDPDGSYGEALDIAFRLLDAPAVNRHSKQPATRLSWLSPATSTARSYATTTTGSTAVPSAVSLAGRSLVTGTRDGSRFPGQALQ